MRMTTHFITWTCAVMIAACSVQPKGAQDPTLMTWAAEQGYQQRAFDGQVVYCRALIPTGSHIEETECVTKKGLAERKYWWDNRNPSAK